MYGWDTAISKKIRQVTERFGLDAVYTLLFSGVKLVRPSNWLRIALAQGYQSPLTNEKSKGEHCPKGSTCGAQKKHRADYSPVLSKY